MDFKSNGLQGLSINSRGESRFHEKYLKLWRLEDPSVAHEVGTSFSPQQINIDLLHQWIDCCHTPPGGRCHKIELPIPSPQIYLINVEEGCLVSAKIDTRSIALSYVWGDAETAQTTKSKLIHLKKFKSIDTNNNSLKLANTIRCPEADIAIGREVLMGRLPLYRSRRTQYKASLS